MTLSNEGLLKSWGKLKGGEFSLFSSEVGFKSNLFHLPARMQTWQRSAATILCAAIDINTQPEFLCSLVPQGEFLSNITEQDPVPNSSAGSQGRKIKDMKTKGNTVTYKMVCDQQGMKSESTGEMTYKGDLFEGATKSKMGPSAWNIVVTSKIKGKRIGQCAKQK